MDIRNWLVDEILQLPDCMFGQRFPIFCSIDEQSGSATWDISEVALPEKCVVWFFSLQSWSNATTTPTIRLALGDQIPTSAAMMTALEPLMMGLGLQGAEPRDLMCPLATYELRLPMKKVIEPSGRRLVLEVTGQVLKHTEVRVALIVSGIPREVPDWLNSVNLNIR